MNWVTWRQHRSEAAIGLLILLLLIFILFLSRQDLYKAYLYGDPQELSLRFQAYAPLTILFQLLPLLIGMFVGVPLMANELDHQTHYLAWTQSISRSRWLAVKLAWVGGTTVLAFLVMTLMLGYWSQPIQMGLGPWLTFDFTGSVYVTYALFALAVGILAGMLLGKVLPAMLITLPVFGLFRFTISSLRRYFLPPLHASWNMNGADPLAKAWILAKDIVDRSGQRVPSFTCVPVASPASMKTSLACLNPLGYQFLRIYQPADRYWTFQAIETLIFLTLTAGVVAFTFWWLNRRVQ
jgi:hypothetical protein